MFLFTCFFLLQNLVAIEAQLQSAKDQDAENIAIIDELRQRTDAQKTEVR